MRLARPWHDGAAIGLAVLVALVGAQVLGILFGPLLLVLAAVVIATAVSPVAGRLERWLPRVAGVLLVYLCVAVVFALFIWIVVPPLVDQVRTLIEDAPTMFEDLEVWLEERNLPSLEQFQDRARTLAESGAAILFTAAPGVFGAFFDVLLVVAMSAYFAIAAPSLVQFAISLIPTAYQPYARDVLTEAGQTMGGYVRGSLLDGAIVAVISYVGLTIIGVDFAVVLALLAFIGEFIPILGPLLAGAPAVAIALTDGVTTALIVLVFYFLIQQFESYVLLPLIMRSQADIPPLLTQVALVTGAAVAGFIGALLAIPLLGGVYVLTLRVFAPAVRAWTGVEAPPWQEAARNRLSGR